MAEGGGTGTAAAASSDAGAGTGEAGSAAAGQSAGTEANATAEADAKDGEGSEKVEGQKGTISDEPVSVENVKKVSPDLNKDHVVGEKEEKKEKHKHHERLSKAFPGREFKADGDYETALDEHLTVLEGYRERGEKANKSLMNYFKSNPELADIVTRGINDGESFRAALARHYNAETLVPKEGDADYEFFNKNSKERLALVEQREKSQEEFNKNLEFSVTQVKEFASENNMTEEKAEAFLGDVDDMLKDIYQGKITKTALTKMLKAFQHDQEVQDAKTEGEIKGRNEKITAEKETKEAKEKGDGLPGLMKGGETEDSDEVESDQKAIVERFVNAGKRRSFF